MRTQLVTRFSQIQLRGASIVGLALSTLVPGLGMAYPGQGRQLGRHPASEAAAETTWVDVGTHTVQFSFADDRDHVVIGRGTRATVTLNSPDGKPIILSTGSAAGHLTVEHLTLRGVRVSDGGIELGAGAIAWGIYGTSAGLTVLDCRFEDNRGDEGTARPCGAGIAVSCYLGEWAVEVRDSEFVENYADQGAAIACMGSERVVIERCSFVSSGAALGGGAILYAPRTTSLTIRDRHFMASDIGNDGSDGIRVACENAVIANVEAEDYGVPSCTKWRIDAVDRPRYPGSFELEDCSMWSAAGSAGQHGGEVQIVLVAAQMRIMHNTFSGVNLIASTAGGRGGTEVSLNALASSRVLLALAPLGDIKCNVFWPSPERLLAEGGQVTGNQTLDPLFCDAVGGDLRVREDSPCVSDSSGCGVIGRWGIGCYGTAVRNSTWGQIKQRFAR